MSELDDQIENRRAKRYSAILPAPEPRPTPPSMRTQAILTALHEAAMEQAQEAFVTPDAERAQVLFRNAFEKEREAAESLHDEPAQEPTRSILYRSAALLALDCKDSDEARRLATEGLKGNPPAAIEAELKEILGRLGPNLATGPASLNPQVRESPHTARISGAKASLLTKSTPTAEKSKGRIGAAASSEEIPAARILWVGLNNAVPTRLPLDEEVRAIDRTLAPATSHPRVEVFQMWMERVSDLQEHLLRTRPSIVHFSGHSGSEGGILARDATGIRQPVEANRLARLLSVFNQRLHCVVLNACYTKEHGEAISEYIDCVVGTSASVSDRAALSFSLAFYAALGAGSSVLAAFSWGRSQVELDQPWAAQAMTLLARHRDPTQLFLAESSY